MKKRYVNLRIILCLLYVSLFIYCNIFSSNKNNNALSLELEILDSAGNSIVEFLKNDTVTLQLSIKNTSDDYVPATYSSSQQYDFYIQKNSETVWKWSNDKFFLTVMLYDTLAPNETLIISEVWPDSQIQTIKIGNYVLFGRHTRSNDGTKERSLSFSIK